MANKAESLSILCLTLKLSLLMTDLKQVFKAPLENVFLHETTVHSISSLDTFDPDIFSSNPWNRLRLWFQIELKVMPFCQDFKTCLFCSFNHFKILTWVFLKLKPRKQVCIAYHCSTCVINYFIINSELLICCCKYVLVYLLVCCILFLNKRNNFNSL